MDSQTVIVLDLETTGLSPYTSKITEIAALKVKDGAVLDSFQTLVNPEIPVPRFITRLTGITNEMVADKPKIQDVLPQLKDFLEDYRIVGHNVRFDYNFLDYNFKKHFGESLPNSTVCTAKLARRILPDLPNKKLGTVAEYYDVVNRQAHRAMADVEATTEIYYRFLDELKSCGLKEFHELCRFQDLSKVKAQSLLSQK